MSKRRAAAPLGESPQDEQEDVLMADDDGTKAPRSSLDQSGRDNKAASARSNPQSLGKASAGAQESEDVTMGNTGGQDPMEAFSSTLSSKLDAVKQRFDVGDPEKQNDKDDERHQKKKRTEAEEGAGSGRYSQW